jgi:hypothetical protein
MNLWLVDHSGSLESAVKRPFAKVIFSGNSGWFAPIWREYCHNEKTAPWDEIVYPLAEKFALA